MGALEEALDFFEAKDPRRLLWFGEFGFGYYPVDPFQAPYDERYFAKYVGYAKTALGDDLNIVRADLVDRFWHGGPIVDIGVGCGAFIEHRPHTYGYDINPAAVEWLHEARRWWNPYEHRCLAVTMWDSLEHIPRFHDLLAQVRRWAFISLPVFDNADDVMASKHMRPDEHCWYFTSWGLKNIMAELGWTCRDENHRETELGRESIGSFAFERVD